MTIGIARSRSGFALVIVVAVIGLLSILMSAAMLHYSSAASSVTEAQTRLQAANYAAEGIELAKAYVVTQTNKDRADGWRNRIAGLSGKYVVTYGAGGYSIEARDSETLEISEPYAGTFVRTVTFADGPGGSEEKMVTSEVEYGYARKVQFTNSVTNVHGK